MSLLFLFLLISVSKQTMAGAPPLTADVVRQRINERLSARFRENDDGVFVPHVCTFCDTFLDPRQIEVVTRKKLEDNASLFQPRNWNGVSQPLADCYWYKGDCGNKAEEENEWIRELLLLPRGCYITSASARRAKGFSACSSWLQDFYRSWEHAYICHSKQLLLWKSTAVSTGSNRHWVGMCHSRQDIWFLLCLLRRN
jgi:hypothetical protein